MRPKKQRYSESYNAVFDGLTGDRGKSKKAWSAYYTTALHRAWATGQRTV